MNDGLIEAFRHNAWATRRVLDVCDTLPDAQLATSVLGTYGSSIDTLRHLVSGEAGYCARLTGEEPSWDWRTEDDDTGLSELRRRADELAGRWEHFLAQPFDANRTFAILWDDDTTRDVPASVLLVQVLHHGTEHRTQVCTTLTTLGVSPLEMGLWRYAADTGRAPVRVG